MVVSYLFWFIYMGLFIVFCLVMSVLFWKSLKVSRESRLKNL